MIQSLYPSFDSNHGVPIVPVDSHQSVEVAVVLFKDGENQYPDDFHTLVDGDSLLGTPPNLQQPLVFWYSSTAPHDGTLPAGSPDHDMFFIHGGFFAPGQAKIQGKIVKVLRSGTDVAVRLQLSNIGNEDGEHTIIEGVKSSKGTDVDTFPYTVGDIGTGMFTDISLHFKDVPSRVKEFVITESGTLTDAILGETPPFSISQKVIAP